MSAPAPAPARDRDEVLDVIAHAFHITADDLLETSLRADRVAARKVAYRLLHELAALSWSQVAAVFGVHISTAIRGAGSAPGYMLTVCREQLR